MGCLSSAWLISSETTYRHLWYCLIFPCTVKQENIDICIPPDITLKRTSAKSAFRNTCKAQCVNLREHSDVRCTLSRWTPISVHSRQPLKNLAGKHIMCYNFSRQWMLGCIVFPVSRNWSGPEVWTKLETKFEFQSYRSHGFTKWPRARSFPVHFSGWLDIHILIDLGEFCSNYLLLRNKPPQNLVA